MLICTHDWIRNVVDGVNRLKGDIPMKKLTMKQVRKARMNAFTMTLNFWYRNEKFLTSKHACWLRLLAE